MALRAVDGRHLLGRKSAAVGDELRDGGGVAAHDDAGAVECRGVPVEVHDGRARNTHALFAGNAYPGVQLVRRDFFEVEREAAYGGRCEPHGVADGGNHVGNLALDEHEGPLVRRGRLDVRRSDQVRALAFASPAAEHEQVGVLAVVDDAFAERELEFAVAFG